LTENATQTVDPAVFEIEVHKGSTSLAGASSQQIRWGSLVVEIPIIEYVLVIPVRLVHSGRPQPHRITGFFHLMPLLPHFFLFLFFIFLLYGSTRNELDLLVLLSLLFGRLLFIAGSVVCLREFQNFVDILVEIWLRSFGR
jgi:hypothetical protein